MTDELKFTKMFRLPVLLYLGHKLTTVDKKNQNHITLQAILLRFHTYSHFPCEYIVNISLKAS